MKPRSHHKAIDCLLRRLFGFDVDARRLERIGNASTAGGDGCRAVVYNDERRHVRPRQTAGNRANQRTRVKCGQEVTLGRPPSAKRRQIPTDGHASGKPTNQPTRPVVIIIVFRVYLSR